MLLVEGMNLNAALTTWHGKNDLKKRFERVVVWWCVNRMIFHLFKAYIPLSSRYSIYPFLQIILEQNSYSAARNWINSVPQAPATTFVFPSVFILILCFSSFYLDWLLLPSLYQAHNDDLCWKLTSLSLVVGVEDLPLSSYSTWPTRQSETHW